MALTSHFRLVMEELSHIDKISQVSYINITFLPFWKRLLHLNNKIYVVWFQYVK